MSWSVSAQGTKDKVKESVSSQLDGVAKMYAGKLEGDDVIACKARLLALIDAVKVPDGPINGVKVTAHGSHSTYQDGIGSAAFTVNVERCQLAI